MYGEIIMKNSKEICDKELNYKNKKMDHPTTKTYVSAVDVVEELSNSVEPRKYWNWLKKKRILSCLVSLDN